MQQVKSAVFVLAVMALIDSCKFIVKKNRNKQLNNEIYCLFIIAMAIWCYRCNSATPGCSDDFNWRGIGFWGEACPEDDDICVKIVERKGGEIFNNIQ